MEDCPESWPPLKVVHLEESFVLVDGFHRYAAAQNLRLDAVPVQIVDAPTDGDLYTLAFELNAVHGKPLTLGDRRAYAERLLLQHSEWADREIGRRCALAQPTVARIRDDLERLAQIERVPERIGAGGMVYPSITATHQRRPGELPDLSLMDSLGDMVGSLFSPRERIQQRKVAQYLQRLAVALEDRANLEGWASPEDVAKACRLAIGDDRSSALAERLSGPARELLSVATALGYQEREQ